VKWLTIEEASAHSRLSPDTLRRLIQRGKLPASRPSARRLVVSERDLDEYLQSCRVGVAPPPPWAASTRPDRRSAAEIEETWGR
jgi:excisionase family DNA binding protein